MSRPRTDTRERLLVQAVEHIATHGLADTSLRDLATALGTSHRMLSFHFGSKAGLLGEVVRVVEEQQLAQIASITPGEGARARLDALSEGLMSPELAPFERLFFEMVGLALQGDPQMAPLLDGLVRPWLAPLAALREAEGIDADTAVVDARIMLAASRGLLLDLLATGDREGVRRAYARLGDLLGGDPTAA